MYDYNELINETLMSQMCLLILKTAANMTGSCWVSPPVLWEKLMVSQKTAIRRVFLITGISYIFWSLTFLLFNAFKDYNVQLYW